MKRSILAILFIVFLASCGKKTEFVDDLQGQWKVTEVQYIYDNMTVVDHPADMKFIFQNYSYQSLSDGTLYETGTFFVNTKVTQIQFQGVQGDKLYLIETNTSQTQTWKSKNKILDFYLRFTLEKQ